MYGSMKSHLADGLASLEKDGLFKKERVIVSVQDASIRLDDGSEVLNFCANAPLRTFTTRRTPSSMLRLLTPTAGFLSLC